MKYPYLLTEQTLTVFVDGEVIQCDRSNPNWENIKAAVNDDPTKEKLVALMKPIYVVADAVSQRNDGVISIRNGVVYFKDGPIHNSLSSRMLDIINEGLDIQPWVLFAQNLYSNPNQYSRNELYEFLEKSDLPLTPDGCFIAYKIVRNDYKDIYTGTMDNSVGQIVVMPGGRSSVDPIRTNLCSTGLHFCSKTYLPSYGTSGGSKVVLVKVNPADVVSIPTDYDNAKGRCWRYEVVGEISFEDAGLHKWESVSSGYDDYCWSDWEDSEDIRRDILWGDDDDGDDNDEFTEGELRELIEEAVSPLKDTVDSILKKIEGLSNTRVSPKPDKKPKKPKKEVFVSGVYQLTEDDVRQALKQHNGNITSTAQALRVPRSTVRGWVKKLT